MRIAGIVETIEAGETPSTSISYPKEIYMTQYKALARLESSERLIKQLNSPALGWI